jgi:hypothetical protein
MALPSSPDTPLAKAQDADDDFDLSNDDDATGVSLPPPPSDPILPPQQSSI